MLDNERFIRGFGRFRQQYLVLDLSRCGGIRGILHSLDKLMSDPWIRRRVEDGKLALHGRYFYIDTGSLLACSARKQEFLNLVQPLDAAA